MRRASLPSRPIQGRAIVLLLVLLALAAGVLALRQYAPRHLPAVLRPPQAEPGGSAVAGLPTEAANPPLYKWQDDTGQWHITDQPPEGRKYEAVRVDPNTNVVPGFVPEETEAETEDE